MGAGRVIGNSPTIRTSETIAIPANNNRPRHRDHHMEPMATTGTAKHDAMTSALPKNGPASGRAGPAVVRKYESQNPRPRHDSAHDEFRLTVAGNSVVDKFSATSGALPRSCMAVAIEPIAMSTPARSTNMPTSRHRADRSTATTKIINGTNGKQA